MDLLKILAVFATTVYLALIYLWTAGALFLDAGNKTLKGYVLLIVWSAVFACTLIFVKPFWLAATVVSLLFVGVVLWWLSQAPTHNHEWDPNFAKLPQIVVEGDKLTVCNLRNTEYRSLEDYDCQYVTREYDLSKLRALDLLILYWGSPLISHPMLIFDFGSNQHLCFSIEVRYRTNQEYDLLKSLYRQQELMYVVSDERDAILRRSKYSDGQDCYLYRLQASLEENREVLDEYIKETNSLVEHPRWYNAITSNCTTTIYRQRHGKIPWDWRILINGTLDKLLYERERLYQGLEFDELRQISWINDRANSAGLENFSAEIRHGLPGFEEYVSD